MSVEEFISTACFYISLTFFVGSVGAFAVAMLFFHRSIFNIDPNKKLISIFFPYIIFSESAYSVPGKNNFKKFKYMLKIFIILFISFLAFYVVSQNTGSITAPVY